MRNLKFVRWGAVLLGLVVLRTKAQNSFCPMCTKGCYTVLNRPSTFWRQFWGQICEAGSHQHRSNKCAALVSLRNTHTHITGFTQVKTSKNRISPTLVLRRCVQLNNREYNLRLHYLILLSYNIFRHYAISNAPRFLHRVFLQAQVPLRGK